MIDTWNAVMDSANKPTDIPPMMILTGVENGQSVMIKNVTDILGLTPEQQEAAGIEESAPQQARDLSGRTYTLGTRAAK